MLRLELERRRRGWSQAELGRRSGLHPSTVSLIEGRRFQPGPIQLEKLATALRIRRADVRTLLEEVEREPAEAAR